ncbi:Transposon TX1 putative 82 kDa ORF 1 [Solea senegalensis]|uniref:Transposon TX1 putative 82 kDa ORF 1 n=1 Tax=Solea senegalensis TaxID=28829 RepID=A0AAV6PVP3_SOLSE|nr:Transposon TX1 putative 82 kDa ORF 1 [Solea senegalensis]
MVSAETLSLSPKHGVRIVPPSTVTVEQVLLAVGDEVGHGNISYASRMNKAVVVFLKQESDVVKLVESGLVLSEEYIQVSPLAVPSTRITVSGVPPFVSNEALEKELRRFGKFASGFRSVGLGCKDLKLRHVQSFRRQVLMYLDSPTQTLDVSFRVKHENGYYMVFASSGNMKCFECGDVGHKRIACPHRRQAAEAAPPAVAAWPTPRRRPWCGSRLRGLLIPRMQCGSSLRSLLAKLAIWKNRKSQVSGVGWTEPVLYLKALVSARLRIEHAFHKLTCNLGLFNAVWGIKQVLCLVSEDGALQVNF